MFGFQGFGWILGFGFRRFLASGFSGTLLPLAGSASGLVGYLR